MSIGPTYKPYIVDITLPPAIIVSPITLTLGYCLCFIFDYLLIKHDTKISVISPFQIKCFIGIYHFLLPILFASKYDFGNISFMLYPWATALQIIFLAKSNIALTDWIPMFLKAMTFQDTTQRPTRTIRLEGLKKLFRGLMKFYGIKMVVDRLLPQDWTSLLALPWLHPQALFMTYLLALRIYGILGITDIIMGLIQCTCLVQFKDVFDNPFMASSPKDFWNKRWNRYVNHLFHQFVFTKMIKNKQQYIKSGLVVFLISGLFHDFMITAVARKLTFELTAFFLIHGIVVGLEVIFRKGKFKKDPTGITYILCNITTILFFTITGRLFLSPVLTQQTFLRIAQQF